MFDLPMETLTEKKAYTNFRKGIMKEGFMMVQKSIYCKLSLNKGSAESSVKSVRNLCPPTGLIQVLVVTENQYQKMEYILGESTNNVIDSNERFIVL